MGSYGGCSSGVTGGGSSNNGSPIVFAAVVVLKSIIHSLTKSYGYHGHRYRLLYGLIITYESLSI